MIYLIDPMIERKLCAGVCWNLIIPHCAGFCPALIGMK